MKNNKSGAINEFHTNMMKYFNTTLSQMNTFKELIKPRDRDLKDQYMIVCKDFVDTKDYFQRFYSSITECLVKIHNIERR
jgi:hypothetical protein